MPKRFAPLDWLIAGLLCPLLAWGQLTRPSPAELDALRARAAQGEAQAQLQLGLVFFSGPASEAERIEGAKWLVAASDQGSWQADATLGDVYLRVSGPPEFKTTGLRLLERAARMGSTFALWELWKHHGAKGEIAAGLPWLERLSSADDPRGLLDLGFLHIKGEWVERDLERAELLISKAAFKGDDEAQYWLAYHHEMGEFERDLKQARAWYLEAAKRGHKDALLVIFRSLVNTHGGGESPYDLAVIEELAANVPRAKSHLAMLRFSGLGGVPKDEQRAVEEWLELAAAGEPDAHFQLYRYYAHLGDKSKAAHHLTVADDSGHHEAVFAYARHVLRGDLPTIEQDVDKALTWLRQHTDKPAARLELAIALISDEYGEQDVAQGLSMLEQLAAESNFEAIVRLARIHTDGEHVPVDYRKALAYLEQASVVSKMDLLNEFAWFLATCPDETIRDGRRALEYAQLAVGIYESAGRVDTLAAAYAAVGDFEQARFHQQQAIELAEQEGWDSGEHLHRRLELYQQGQTWSLADDAHD